MKLYEFEKYVLKNPIGKIEYDYKAQDDYCVCDSLKANITFTELLIFNNPNVMVLKNSCGSLRIDLIKEIYIVNVQCGRNMLHVICNSLYGGEVKHTFFID